MCWNECQPKSSESDKDRDSDDYENDYDNFAPPPQPTNVQNNAQQQGRNLIIKNIWRV